MVALYTLKLIEICVLKNFIQSFVQILLFFFDEGEVSVIACQKNLPASLVKDGFNV